MTFKKYYNFYLLSFLVLLLSCASKQNRGSDSSRARIDGSGDTITVVVNKEIEKGVSISAYQVDLTEASYTRLIEQYATHGLPQEYNFGHDKGVEMYFTKKDNFYFFKTLAMPTCLTSLEFTDAKLSNDTIYLKVSEACIGNESFKPRFSESFYQITSKHLISVINLTRE